MITLAYIYLIAIDKQNRYKGVSLKEQIACFDTEKDFIYKIVGNVWENKELIGE